MVLVAGVDLHVDGVAGMHAVELGDGGPELAPLMAVLTSTVANVPLASSLTRTRVASACACALTNRPRRDAVALRGAVVGHVGHLGGCGRAQDG